MWLNPSPPFQLYLISLFLLHHLLISPTQISLSFSPLNHFKALSLSLGFEGQNLISSPCSKRKNWSPPLKFQGSTTHLHWCGILKIRAQVNFISNLPPSSILYRWGFLSLLCVWFLRFIGFPIYCLFCKFFS